MRYSGQPALYRGATIVLPCRGFNSPLLWLVCTGFDPPHTLVRMSFDPPPPTKREVYGHTTTAMHKLSTLSPPHVWCARDPGPPSCIWCVGIQEFFQQRADVLDT